MEQRHVHKLRQRKGMLHVRMLFVVSFCNPRTIHWKMSAENVLFSLVFLTSYHFYPLPFTSYGLPCARVWSCRVLMRVLVRACLCLHLSTKVQSRDFICARFVGLFLCSVNFSFLSYSSRYQVEVLPCWRT